MTEIKPGSFGLSIINGKTGRWVAWGQNIVDGRKEKFTHAFFVLDNNQVLEAEPKGAKIVSLDKYTSRPADQVLFCDKPVQDYLATVSCSNRAYCESQIRSELVACARKLENTPYNYLDYLAIGLEHFGIDLPFIRNRVRREDRLICSQLCDLIYSKHDIHLFNDGRQSQDVTPGDLEAYALGII